METADPAPAAEPAAPTWKVLPLGHGLSVHQLEGTGIDLIPEHRGWAIWRLGRRIGFDGTIDSARDTAEMVARLYPCATVKIAATPIWTERRLSPDETWHILEGTGYDVSPFPGGRFMIWRDGIPQPVFAGTLEDAKRRAEAMAFAGERLAALAR